MIRLLFLKLVGVGYWLITREVPGSYEDTETHYSRFGSDGGKPCIRGLRVTVGMVVGLLAAGRATEEILQAYPYLEEEDIREALAYAAWRAEEFEVPLSPG